MEIHFLKPDNYLIREDGIIFTVLGTCVAINIWDAEKKIAAMVHYRISDNVDEKSFIKSGKYLTELMFKEMEKIGILKHNMIGDIVGGLTPKGEIAQRISKENIEFAKRTLKSKGIKVRTIDTGEEFPRRVRFYVETGEISIKKVEG